MAIVQAKEVKPIEQGQRVDERLMKPGKYEITKDTLFTVEIYTKEKDGRWLIMNGPGKGIMSNFVVFRMWGFDEMVEIRKLATSYDAGKRMHMLDNDMLNRLKIQRLMVSWTFDKENPRLRIQHVNDTMTDESWKSFTLLQPNISGYIIDEMNKVYEFNG